MQLTFLLLEKLEGMYQSTMIPRESTTTQGSSWRGSNWPFSAVYSGGKSFLNVSSFAVVREELNLSA